MKTYVQIRTRFEGGHCFPGAPPEVQFLSSPHRHEFRVRVKLEVGHDDREIEFLILKRQVEAIVKYWGFDLGASSCESIARNLHQQLTTIYGTRSGEIEISE